MKKLNEYIDHTLLSPTATTLDIKQLCEEAIQYEFYAVCVNSCHVKDACRFLTEHNIKLASVIGFPLGAMSSFAKAYEADDAIEQGADEIDMVMNIGALKEGNFDYVLKDVSVVATITHDGNALLKVIIETCFLTEDEIKKACQLAVSGGADFVKTSTGFGTMGATVDNVKLMKSAVDGNAKIKASGGIRDKETALAMIEAGADRLGVSASIKIVT